MHPDDSPHSLRNLAEPPRSTAPVSPWSCPRSRLRTRPRRDFIAAALGGCHFGAAWVGSKRPLIDGKQARSLVPGSGDALPRLRPGPLFAPLAAASPEGLGAAATSLSFPRLVPPAMLARTCFHDFFLLVLCPHPRPVFADTCPAQLAALPPPSLSTCDTGAFGASGLAPCLRSRRLLIHTAFDGLPSNARTRTATRAKDQSPQEAQVRSVRRARKECAFSRRPCDEFLISGLSCFLEWS